MNHVNGLQIHLASKASPPGAHSGLACGRVEDGRAHQCAIAATHRESLLCSSTRKFGPFHRRDLPAPAELAVLPRDEFASCSSSYTGGTVDE